MCMSGERQIYSGNRKKAPVDNLFCEHCLALGLRKCSSALFGNGKGIGGCRIRYMLSGEKGNGCTEENKTSNSLHAADTNKHEFACLAAQFRGHLSPQVYYVHIGICLTLFGF